MKKFAAMLLVCFVIAVCCSCGPYSDYAGTYTKSSSSATYTVTLSASGKFRFERKFKTSNQFNPYDDDKHNIREGTFTVQDEKIIIEFSYYDDALRDTVKETATAKISGDKLIILEGSDISGTFTKQ